MREGGKRLSAGRQGKVEKICCKYNFPLVGMVVDLYVTCACIMFKVSFSGGRHGGFEKC